MLGGDDDEPSTKSKPAAPRISNPSNLQMNSQQTNQAQAQVSEKSKPATGGGGGLFDLDWHEPAPSTSNPTSPFVHSNNKGKNDILSLFGNSSGGGGGFQQQQQQQGFNQQQQSGLSGLDGFGGMNLGNNNHQNSNFGGVTSPSTNTGGMGMGMGMGINDPWASNSNSSGIPQAQRSTAAGGSGVFDSHDIWGSSSHSNSAVGGGNTSTNGAGKKENAFDDLWSDFK